MPKSRIIYFAIFTILCSIIISSWNMRTGQFKTFEDEMKHRALSYIQVLQERPVSKLQLEEKLLLLHSYYVAGDYQRTVQLAEALKGVLENLPEERKDAFNIIVRDAYIKSGAQK